MESVHYYYHHDIRQMLIDLKESEKLMKSFTQDYIVDSIDSLLTSEHGNMVSITLMILRQIYNIMLVLTLH